MSNKEKLEQNISEDMRGLNEQELRFKEGRGERSENQLPCAFCCEKDPCNYVCILIKITYSCFSFSVGLV